ncbi:Acyl-CoA-binding domain-containing protein 6 [Geodia barretti]|nr:Acyl-CoA-binding domain-containing protein 6 [Geodia barretti]
MTKDEAVTQYLATVSAISPEWETVSPTEDGGDEEGEGGGGGVGPTVSRLADQEEELAEEEKTVFDWCKEGREDRLRSHLTPNNINNRDNEGMTLLHWACDRGRLNIVELLATRGADINSQDDDKQTPLHYASSCDQVDVVTYLLSKGADPSIKDCDDLTPAQVAGDPSTRQLFHTLSDQ